MFDDHDGWTLLNAVAVFALGTGIKLAITSVLVGHVAEIGLVTLAAIVSMTGFGLGSLASVRTGEYRLAVSQFVAAGGFAIVFLVPSERLTLVVALLSFSLLLQFEGSLFVQFVDSVRKAGVGLSDEQHPDEE